MAESLFSASWYRVSALRPKLRSHARVHRHLYRGKPWYVLQDLTNQKFQRFSADTHALLGMMDGERTVHEIWTLATETLGDASPTQDDMIRLLAQLHMADLLQSDIPPDTAELLARHRQRERRETLGRFLNPFAIRIPLFDPERFLVRGLPWIRPMMGWTGLALWLVTVTSALVLAGLHWSELSEGFIDRLFTAQTLIAIWLVFPLLKALHELGHGFIAKSFGCEIHDMGVMFLVFTPIPYVDASSSSALPDRERRALVGAGGMIVEAFVAALAMFVWVSAEPGVARTIAYNTMLIGGVTTVLFNGNPLLRFDGYYILADLLEIPNLRSRSNSFIGYLVERYAFGRREAERPETTPREPSWLVGFAVSSFLYRIFVIAAIFLFVLEISLVLGTFLILLASVTWFALPAVRGLRALLGERRLDEVRGRALGVVVGSLTVVVLLVGVIPFPYRTLTEGVVWVPEEALVRAGTDGFIERLVAKPGATIRAGDALIECSAPELSAEAKVLAARLRVLNARYHDEFREDRVRAQMVDEERHHVRERLARAQERLGELTIRSAIDGVFSPPQPEDLPGRFVRQGQAIAHVLPSEVVKIRAVVAQDDIDLVRERTQRTQVRLSERLDEVVAARVQRIVPSASERLPSTALGSAGGGLVAIDPRDDRGVSAIQKHFVVEMELAGDPRVANLGGRVHVRFDHGREVLALQAFRALRQLFLSRLDV